MKRIKSMGLSVCAILLAAVIFIGSGSIVIAKADDSTPTTQVPEFLSGRIVNEVELGGSFEIPVNAVDVDAVIVKAPNGQPVTPDQSNMVYANQLGNYTVEIRYDSNAKSTYTYNVFCSMTEEYSVFVEYDGAKIPTFMATNGSFIVPDVFLGYYDDEGELNPYTPPTGHEADINGFTVTAVGGKITKENGKLKVTAEVNGTMILRYAIEFSEGKFYSKEYSITVQDGFVNNSTPKLSVVNVPTTANINSKVTLPIATATSSFDERVFVEVIVTHNDLKTTTNPEGRAVKVANINKETGYAEPREDEEEVILVFDNVRDMSFYPTKLGTYTVSYQAIDTAGNRTPVPHYFSIECTDGLAPIFTDLARDQIPTKWGLNVMNKSGTALADTSITFPIPEVADNYDGIEDLAVSFRIIDHKSRVVLRFTNILNATAEHQGLNGTGHKASNALYDDGKEQAFTENGFVFNFGDYNVDDITGTYTIEYRVSDKNNKTRTYSPSISIELVRSFEDTKSPTIDPIDPVRYILIGENGDDQLEIPKVVVSDDNDSHTSIDYTIAFEPEGGTRGTAYPVDDIDTLDIVPEEAAGVTKYFLYTTEGVKLFEISKGTLYLSCKATDDAFNVSSFPSGEYQVAEIKVYSSEATNFDFDANFITAPKTIGRNASPEVNLGDFKIETDSNDDVKFVGFEILLKNPNNGIANVSLERMMIDDTIYVKNVTFSAVFTGQHDLYIRVFDITGVSVLYMYSFDITVEAAGSGPYAVPMSAIIPETAASQNTKYSLRSIPNENTASSDTFAVLKVSGGSFSLIGFDFIANSTGAFNFQETSIAATECTAPDFGYGTDPNFNEAHRTYSTFVNAFETPVIEVLGSVPVYSEKHATLKETERFTHTAKPLEEYGWVVLPSVAAFNNTNNLEVRITITDRNGDPINSYKVYENAAGDLRFFEEGSDTGAYYFANRWAFAPTADGAVTITYEAVWNGSTRATSTHTVLVGKITVPVVTLDELPRNAYTIGTTYNFFTIKEVKDDADITDSQIQRYTVTKKLIDPSGSTIVNVSGTLDKYKDVVDNDGKDIVLEKNGTYTEVYEVTDLYGNKTTIKRDFQVTAKSRTATASMKMLSTILIIVAVLLLAGVVFYILKFRTVKKIKR